MHALLVLAALSFGGPLSASSLVAEPAAVRPAPPLPSPPKPAPAPAPSVPIKRQLWQLIAEDGTRFRMYEKDELIAVVANYNRDLPARPTAAAAAPPTFQSGIPQFSGGCANGQCSR